MDSSGDISGETFTGLVSGAATGEVSVKPRCADGVKRVGGGGEDSRFNSSSSSLGATLTALLFRLMRLKLCSSSILLLSDGPALLTADDDRSLSPN